MEHGWLLLFAFMAGFVDAVVGGGGLIQMPALFLFLPAATSADSIVVLGTNKLASICGTTVAMIQYARRVPVNWRVNVPASLAALVFSCVGALVVSHVPNAVLRPLVLVLLMLVGGYTFFHRDFGSIHRPRFQGRFEIALAMVVGSGIGFYDGFFGPGTGSFLIFLFIGLFGFDFLTASASAKVVNVATNLSAVAYFAYSDKILYHVALPMGLCNILGSLLGARLAILKGNRFVRVFFLLVVTAMILRFGYEVVFR